MQLGLRYAVLALGIALSSNASLAFAESPPFAPEDMPAQPAHTGTWFDPAHTGHGVVLNILSPYEASITWETYTPEGKPLWLVGTGRIEANRIVFALVSSTAAGFPTSAPASPPKIANWGQLYMTFQSCNEATLRWTPTASGYAEGTANIKRLTQPAGLVCDDEPSLFNYGSYGAPPAEVGTNAEGKSVVAVGGELVVGTRDGLWKRKLDIGSGVDDSRWVRAGLDGFDVAFIVADQSGGGRLFVGGTPKDGTEKPFYYSDDSGRTWKNARSAFFDEGRGRHEAFTDLAVWPQDPLIMYASLEGGPGVAVSTNGGRDWKRADGSTDSYIGYPCRLAFVPGARNRLYQGCEALLDSVRIGYFDVDENAFDRLGELKVLAGTSVDGADVDNRRPNLLLGSEARPGVLYAGLEGALIGIRQSGMLEKVYFSPLDADPATNPYPYIYVSAIWIDPNNPFHMIFGGGLNGDNVTTRLYETYDHGLRLRDVGLDSDALAQRNPIVDSIIALDRRGDHFVYVVKAKDATGKVVPEVFRLDRRRGIGLPTLQ